MGKMVRWARGWEVGPTPYQYHIMGLHFFQRMRFKVNYRRIVPRVIRPDSRR